MQNCFYMIVRSVWILVYQKLRWTCFFFLSSALLFFFLKNALRILSQSGVFFFFFAGFKIMDCAYKNNRYLIVHKHVINIGTYLWLLKQTYIYIMQYAKKYAHICFARSSWDALLVERRRQLNSTNYDHTI